MLFCEVTCNMTKKNGRRLKDLRHCLSQKTTLLSSGIIHPLFKSSQSGNRHSQMNHQSDGCCPDVVTEAHHNHDSGFEKFNNVATDYTSGSQRVMGRRELRAKHSTNWDSESVDSGHGSLVSSGSGLSQAMRASQYASQAIPEPDHVKNDVRCSSDHIDLCDNVAYCSVQQKWKEEETWTEGEDTYISIDSDYYNNDTHLSPILPRKYRQSYANVKAVSEDLPDVNPGYYSLQKKTSSFEKKQNRSELSSNVELKKKPSQFTKMENVKRDINDIIIQNRYHTYTVDDIVDSYINLVGDIPQEADHQMHCKIQRKQSVCEKKSETPTRRELRRSKSGGELRPSLPAVYKAASCMAISIKLLDCDEVF